MKKKKRKRKKSNAMNYIATCLIPVPLVGASAVIDWFV